jgi:hypothetical protein
MKNINTNAQAIVFAQAQDSTKAVVSDKYVAHALFAQNKPIWEALGGTRIEGVKGLRIEFKTVKNAKEFIAQAITHIDADDYAKARKTEPKAKVEPKAKKVAPTTAKGKKADDLVTVTLADGTPLQVSASALGIKTEPKKAPRKSKGDAPTTAPKSTPNAKAKTETKAKAPTKAKGNAELTPNAQKTLARMKMSVLNRAASAYSIANGGTAVNFDTLGKTEKDLTAYIPNAKAGLLKSNKWAKAVEMGITEDMLGF